MQCFAYLFSALPSGNTGFVFLCGNSFKVPHSCLVSGMKRLCCSAWGWCPHLKCFREPRCPFIHSFPNQLIIIYYIIIHRPKGSSWHLESIRSLVGFVWAMISQTFIYLLFFQGYHRPRHYIATQGKFTLVCLNICKPTAGLQCCRSFLWGDIIWFGEHLKICYMGKRGRDIEFPNIFMALRLKTSAAGIESVTDLEEAVQPRMSHLCMKYERTTTGDLVGLGFTLLEVGNVNKLWLMTLWGGPVRKAFEHHLL